MTDDLIARLRCYPANRLCRQVADALEAKNARIAELTAALKPFAELAEYYDVEPDAQPAWDRDFQPTVGELRAAAAAIRGV